jgi:hypothetical protein
MHPADRKKIATQLRAAARKIEGAGKAKDVTGLVTKLAEMTDDNDHTGAVIELAKWLGNKKLLAAANGIKMIHEAMGSMPYEISQFRLSLLKEIIAEVAKKHGQEVADQIDTGF